MFQDGLRSSGQAGFIRSDGSPVNRLDSSPSNHNQRPRRLKEWGLSTALLGASFLPCPECGMPVAIHTWPFLLLFAARWPVKRQKGQLDDLPGGERQSSTVEEVKKAD